MALEDYFKGSSKAYGQLAGSLLASNRKTDKKAIKRSLLATTIAEIFGAAQGKLKQGVIDAANDVKEKYSLIFKDNEELYANESVNRNNYKRFIDDEESYLQEAAIKTFNANPYLRKELGNVNAFSAVNRETLDEDSYNKAIEVFESIKKGEKEKMLKFAENPAISISTFTKFNEPAMNAYNAALAEVEDDPTKQSLIKAAFNKYFGEDRDGNKRFGMVEAAKLTEARKTAERNRVAALNKSRIPLSPQKQEDISVEETTTINNNVKKEIMYFAGTDIPVDFDFQTNKQMLKLQKDSFAKKVNSKDYQITVDDIVDAVEYGYTIPGFSGLKNIMAGDRENLVKIAAKVKIGKQKGLNPESEGVLNPAERRIWSIATNINLDNLQKNSMDLIKSKIQMKDAERKAGFVNIDDNKVMKNFSNKDLVATVNTQINSYLEENDNLKTIYTDNLEQTSRDAFVFNVFNTIEYLTETKKINFTSAINEAIDIQMKGIYKFQDDPTRIINPLSWTDNTTHRVEFVDLNVINQLSKNIETDQDARNMRDYMNDYRYVQNLTDEKGVNLRPDSLGKEFVEGNYRFFVVDIDPRENLNVLKWDYQYIGD